ncbi:MAG: histone deacetylase family protein [Hyphomonadaceae bacterium]
MKIFSSPHQRSHAPELELQNGEMVPFAEKPERLDSMLEAFDTITPSEDFGMAPILAVHASEYVLFLQSAHAAWSQAGRSGDAIPYVFPVRGRRPLRLARIDAQLGQFAFDCGTPIAANTWEAAYWNAQTAISGMHDVLNGAASALSLCRPPGHHAGRDYMGGYCYLNNAAIAAQLARNSGKKRVAILDVDYHHGNGTQDLFYERGDVLTISLHADPSSDYPFYWGHADETGEGQGFGANMNLPMPQGTGWTRYRSHLSTAVETVRKFAPDLLIVPFGADTFRGDPISHFKIDTPDYEEMGRDIAQLDLPCLIVTEGGYNIDYLGKNVRSFVTPFMS